MPTAISPFVLADWIQPGAALTVVLGLAGFLWRDDDPIPATIKLRTVLLRKYWKTSKQVHMGF